MSDPGPAAPPKSIARATIPAGVWVLGLVSMLMDISSEMIHSLLPLFLVGTLGVSVLAVGIVEGLAESTALISKVFSGALSDYLGKRKGLALLGYAMGALTKPVFAMATGVGAVVAARFIDRVGKGIRGAPRDALLADITPASIRGAAFGLRQSLDTVGAFAGPLLATGLMLAWANDFRAVFWVAVIPAVLAVLLLLVGIREPEHKRPGIECRSCGGRGGGAQRPGGHVGCEGGAMVHDVAITPAPDTPRCACWLPCGHPGCNVRCVGPLHLSCRPPC
jgi:hypothetical protein